MTFPRWKRIVLVAESLTPGRWELMRPVRLAHDWGLIDTDEYWRRQWEWDPNDLPLACYQWDRWKVL